MNLHRLDKSGIMNAGRTDVLASLTTDEKADSPSSGQAEATLTRHADEPSAQAAFDFTFAFHNVKELHAVIERAAPFRLWKAKRHDEITRVTQPIDHQNHFLRRILSCLPYNRSIRNTFEASSIFL